MAKINSRQKGARAERQLAKKLNEYGYGCRRGQQFSGLHGNADVVGLPYIHIESKHVERLNIFDAMAQSVRDAREEELPTVMHKKNHTEWLCTMRLNDWMRLYQAYELQEREEQNK